MHKVMPKESPKSYREAKDRRVSLALTQTGFQGLNGLAEARGVSLSELLERIGRGIIALDREGQLLGELCANWSHSSKISWHTTKRKQKRLSKA